MRVDWSEEQEFLRDAVAGVVAREAGFTTVRGWAEAGDLTEADALAGMTFTGAPLRVYLAFVAMPDTSGEALALIALYDDHRIEARILRGGAAPLYAIFALSET